MLSFHDDICQCCVWLRDFVTITSRNRFRSLEVLMSNMKAKRYWPVSLVSGKFHVHLLRYGCLCLSHWAHLALILLSISCFNSALISNILSLLPLPPDDTDLQFSIFQLSNLCSKSYMYPLAYSSTVSESGQ